MKDILTRLGRFSRCNQFLAAHGLTAERTMVNHRAVAAYAACFLLLCLGVFQLLLVAGAPLGHFAWGGQHLVLPLEFRIGSAVSLLVYTGFATVILDNASVIAVLPKRVSTTLVRVTAGYFFLGVAVNLISPSLVERVTMAPVAFILGVLTLIVAKRR